MKPDRVVSERLPQPGAVSDPPPQTGPVSDRLLQAGIIVMMALFCVALYSSLHETVVNAGDKAPELAPSGRVHADTKHPLTLHVHLRFTPTAGPRQTRTVIIVFRPAHAATVRFTHPS